LFRTCGSAAAKQFYYSVQDLAYQHKFCDRLEACILNVTPFPKYHIMKASVEELEVKAVLYLCSLWRGV
jgi:hypothetical protein